MHAIDALLSGLRGCEEGSAKVFRRGTTLRATVYADFEASSADSSGDDIDLDENGGATVYVNELVLVQAYDAQGNLMREFVAGSQAYAVEVISSGFTGTNYETGVQAVSKPTTVGALLDLWFASAGGTDWKGSYSGSATNLKNIFGALYGLLYNVKSPEYGAVGNGVDNDTAAFQAAHDAAVAHNGGIVVVPPGTYNISATLAWTAGVSLICVPGTVTIRTTAGATKWLTIASSAFGASESACVIAGIRFDSTVANSATQIEILNAGSTEIQILNCIFGNSANVTGSGVTITSSESKTTIRNCVATMQSDAAHAFFDNCAVGAEFMEVLDCTVTGYNGAAPVSMVLSTNNPFRVRGCNFFYRATSGTVTAISYTATTATPQVEGCRFIKSSGGSINYALGLTAVSDAVFAADNFHATSVKRYLSAVAAGSEICAFASQLSLLPFINAVVPLTTATIPDGYASHYMEFSSTFPAITMPQLYQAGQELDVVVKNVSGGAWTNPPTFVHGAGFVIYDVAAIPAALNDTKRFTLRFRGIFRGANWYWMQIGQVSSAF